MNCIIQSVSRPYLRHLFVHVPDFTVHPKNTLITSFCQRFAVCVLGDEISCEASGNVPPKLRKKHIALTRRSSPVHNTFV
jgi:hypothetical protein